MTATKIDLTTGEQVQGTLPVGNGGTGATTLTGLLVGNGTSAVTVVAAPSGQVVGTTDTQTETNKRITPRIVSTTASTAPSINTDSCDQFNLTAQSAPITSMTTNLTGTPTDGQKLIVRIKDDGSAHPITWGASWRAVGVSLPTTTVISKTLYVGSIYNGADSLWDVVAVGQQ